MTDHSQAREQLLALFEAALEASRPARCVPPALPVPPAGRTIVIGAGKAAAAMAQAVEQAVAEQWPAEARARLSGLVVTRYGHGAPCERIEVIEAAHPVPDAAGEDAARRILGMVRGLQPEDLVLCLVSGGGSSLLALPIEGIELRDKQQINRALLKSGASISEMNCVRKHLSSIKGGRLALACAPARVVTLLISDVPGDEPGVIASGPTLADPTTCADALTILDRHRIEVSDHVRAVLRSGAGETPKPGDPRFHGHEVHVLATADMALRNAANKARELGLTPHVLSDLIEGEARDVARVLGAIALRCATHDEPFARPCVLLSGGETTVTVRGTGRGGRNAEFLLSLARTLGGAAGIHALACDTDGIDGSEDNAGAVCGPDSLRRAAALGIKPGAMLDNNDGYGFFSALGDLVITGPTRTNVNDFRAILIL